MGARADLTLCAACRRIMEQPERGQGGCEMRGEVVCIKAKIGREGLVQRHTEPVAGVKIGQHSVAELWKIWPSVRRAKRLVCQHARIIGCHFEPDVERFLVIALTGLAVIQVFRSELRPAPVRMVNGQGAFLDFGLRKETIRLTKHRIDHCLWNAMPRKQKEAWPSAGGGEVTDKPLPVLFGKAGPVENGDIHHACALCFERPGDAAKRSTLLATFCR